MMTPLVVSIDGDEDGGVVIHADLPNLYYGSGPLSGALNGPDGEQLQRTSMGLTLFSRTALHLQQPSRTEYNARVVI